MSKNNLITIHAFGQEIGLLGFDPDKSASYFQYNETFLLSEGFSQMFPLIFRKTKMTQVFDKYNNDTFRGLPPMIADSLPDLFGNIIFKAWMEAENKNMAQISVLEQLAYVGTRGMGALEYQPSKTIASSEIIDIESITKVVKQVLAQKNEISGAQMDNESLLNIFKMGTSAGGMRPKILISENKENGTIIPGDIIIDDRHNHYLVKLDIDDAVTYSREIVEFSYFKAATHAGVQMMDCKMIENKHFATLRFDRQNGKKKHVLTATGLTGYDYLDPKPSQYETLFALLNYLKCPHSDMEQLFRRMIFNLVFANSDDHLKNHSFIYDENLNEWGLAPAYDLTYSLNPELNIKTKSRALSINGKRENIELSDIKTIAEKYTIKNPMGIISQVQDSVAYWKDSVKELGLPTRIIAGIEKNFTFFS